MNEIHLTINLLNRAVRLNETTSIVCNHKQTKKLLQIIVENNYAEITVHGNTATVRSTQLTKIGEIKGNCSSKAKNLAKWRAIYLTHQPAGRLILSTTKGLIDDVEAVRTNTGGKLVCFFY